MGVFWQGRLALRLLWREAKSGELNLIFWALLLAVTSATAIALFSARLDLAMQQRALEVLGADLRLESTAPINEHWQQRAQDLGLKTTTSIHFPSMILAGDEMAMAAVKVVTAGYPLKGELSLENLQDATQPLLQNHGPLQGEAWIEPKLAHLLQVTVGDVLEVGRIQLTLTGIIAKESDRGAGFYSFSPRLMMNAADLAAADLISTGSRARWRLLLVGNASALAKFQEYELAAHEKFQTLQSSNQILSERLSNAQRYLGLAAMLAVVLACVAIAMSAKQYAERNFSVSALMRTFGLARKQVLTIYIIQLLTLALVASAVGLLLASLVQQVLLWLLSDVLPPVLPPAPLSAWWLGGSAGVISLLGFAIPYVLPLARVSPLKVLRKELQPVPLAGWSLSIIAMGALTGLLWLFTQDLILVLATLGGAVTVLGLLFMALVYALGAVQKRLAGRALPLTWRFAWQHLSMNKRHSAGQILAFALTLMVMVLIFTLRNDLLSDWQNGMPADSPNVFAINIQPYELDDFQQHLQSLEITPQKLYPTMPARLVSINQRTVSELAIAEDSSINRDLILTADNDLPSTNELTQGTWHDDTTTLAVSIEEQLAKRLGIHLHDNLTFNLAGQPVEVRVTSMRKVDWGAMTPNFFMVLSEDAFVNQPVTYMTSMYIAPDSHALAELVRGYPSITFFDTTAILEQIQTLLEQVTLAIEWILVFVLLSAVLVMLASLTTGLEIRLREGAIVRTFGASRTMLKRAQLAEFSLLASISALFALLGAEVLRYVLYQYFLKIEWHSLGVIWIILPILAMGLMILPSQWLLRSTVNTPPVNVLRRL